MARVMRDFAPCIQAPTSPMMTEKIRHRMLSLIVIHRPARIFPCWRSSYIQMKFQRGASSAN